MALRSLRTGLLALGLGVALAACRVPPTIGPEPSIAIASESDRLYLARADRLTIVEFGSPGIEVDGPCDRYVDLETWAGRLFALCGDGQVFDIAEPPSDSPPGIDDWQPVEILSTGPLAALQRSEGMLLAVGEDGGMTLISTPLVVTNEDLALSPRLRGLDRGGPDESPIASVGPDALIAHAIALERGPELVVAREFGSTSCSIRLPGAEVRDLAASEGGVAATIVDRDGRVWVVHVRTPRRARATWTATDASGDHRRLAIDCREI